MPKVLVDEFEKGTKRSIQSHTLASGGQAQTMLSSQIVKDDISQPAAKRPHLDAPDTSSTKYVVRVIISSFTGYSHVPVDSLLMNLKKTSNVTQ